MKKLIAICLLLTAQPALAEKQLIFFFAASCKYCHNLAPIIEKAGETFQIHILPTSLDGGTLPAFPEATKNLKLAQAFNVHSLPTVAGVDTVAPLCIIPLSESPCTYNFSACPNSSFTIG